MSDVFRFLLLGIGSGALDALLSLGVVLVYRGSGVVNFAAGAFALFGGSVYYEAQGALGDVGAIIVAIVATALLGLLVQVLIMGPMRHSSPLARVVATLAIVTVIQQGAVLKYGTQTIFVTGILPTGAVHLFGVVVGENYLYIMAIVAVLLILLSLAYTRTRFGLLTKAVAENEMIPASQGSSPALIAAGNWALGGALAGLAGALLVPISGLDNQVLPLAIVPVLAAALVGGFNSFWLTVGGSLLIGVLQSETNRYVTTPGWSDAIPFIVIVVFLTVRGRSLPLRSHLAERLPRLGAGQLSIGKILTALVLVGISLAFFGANWSAAVTNSAVFAILCLSLVVVTGLCGQLSLAQFALAGVGALVSGRLAAVYHLPFLLAFGIALVVAVPVGLLVALPAVRVRGINLAVLTMGLGVAVTSVLLNNPNYTGGPITGTVVSPPTIFGLSVNSVTYPARYAWVCLIAATISAIMISNVRRGRSGRRMIAVRDNERAAASLGVSVVGAKLYAFSLAAALAAASGVLLAFQYTQVTFDGYSVFASINLLLTSVLGGIGHILGAIVGGGASVGGVAQDVINLFIPTSSWYLFVAAAIVLVNLVFMPDGLATGMARQAAMAGNLAARIVPPRIRKGAASALERFAPGRISRERHAPDNAGSGGKRPARRLPIRSGGEGILALSGITVQFGGVTALRNVSCQVRPGEVVGLIGPNGAGKTTLVDVATGYVRATQGSVTLAKTDITRWPAMKRSRLGLTRSFQSLELFEDLSVADNLRVASDRRDRLAYLSDLLRPGRPPFSDVMRAVIDEFELAGVLRQSPEVLPYAQRHLVAIARAVAASPAILLLDEPGAGLDQVSIRELGRLIRRLASEWGMGVLLIEHNVPLVLDTCDRIVVLDFGQVIAEGTPEMIRNNEAVIAAYLGADLVPRASDDAGDDAVSTISADGADYA
jgi:sulfate-transporting ATPase